MSKIQNIFNKRNKPKQDDHFIGAVLKSGQRFGLDQDGFVMGKKTNTKRLPTWSDLSRPDSATKILGGTAEAHNGTRGGYPTLKFSISVALVVLLAVLYVRHVYTTRTLLHEVVELRRANLSLHLQTNRLHANYENIKFEDGENASKHPIVLIDKAKKLGLKEGWEFGETIFIKE